MNNVWEKEEIAHDAVVCEKSYWIYAQNGGILRVFPSLTDVLKKGEDLVGYYEQEYHPGSNEVELINLGVLKEFRGLKLGSSLVNHAIASASRKNPERMWVHTCSLDHKHALQNYKSKGFEIFKEEEIDFVA